MDEVTLRRTGSPLLPKNAQITFKRDQGVVSISSFHVIRLAFIFPRPTLGQPFLLRGQTVRTFVLQLVDVKLWLLLRSIARATKHHVTGRVVAYIPEEVCAENPLEPSPFLGTFCALSLPSSTSLGFPEAAKVHV